MFKLSYKLLIVISALVVLLSPAVLHAQSIGFGPDGSGTVNIIASTGFYNTGVATADFLDTTFGQLIAIFLGFLGAVFLALIIYSGFQWMTAGGNEEKVADAKKRILNAAIGIGLIFFAYIITNLVFNFIYKQNEPRPGNPNNECEANADCQQLTPFCESFIIAGQDAKRCVCFDNRGPACPAGYHCEEQLLDQTENRCEPDES